MYQDLLLTVSCCSGDFVFSKQASGLKRCALAADISVLTSPSPGQSLVGRGGRMGSSAQTQRAQVFSAAFQACLNHKPLTTRTSA